VGCFVFAPLCKYLLMVYAWQSAMLIVSGITLNGVVFGALLVPLRPPVHYRKPRSKTFFDRLREKAAKQTKRKRSRSECSEDQPKILQVHCTTGTLYCTYTVLQVLCTTGTLYYRYTLQSTLYYRYAVLQVHCTLYCRYTVLQVLCTAGTLYSLHCTTGTLYYRYTVLQVCCTAGALYSVLQVHCTTGTLYYRYRYSVLQVLCTAGTLYTLHCTTGMLYCMYTVHCTAGTLYYRYTVLQVCCTAGALFSVLQVHCITGTLYCTYTVAYCRYCVILHKCLLVSGNTMEFVLSTVPVKCVLCVAALT